MPPKAMWFRLVAAFMLAGSAAAGARGSAGQPAALKVAWAPCASTRTRTQCGAISVFENRTTGRGRRIDIRFLVSRADRPPARDALFVLAGGPGQGSVSMAAAAGEFAGVRQSMDLVFVDQRGTGDSHVLDCPSPAASNPASAFGHVFDPSLVRACRQRLEQNADLTQYTTDSAAGDLDDVRSALGYAHVSLYGVSYGTRLAQAYARRFPNRVKALVLDGTVPFDNNITLSYASSAQQSLRRVFQACRGTPTCQAAHPRLESDFAAIMRRFDQGTVPARVQAGVAEVPVMMSRGDFGYALRGILYSQNLVPRLPDMIGRAAASGDLSEFAQRYWGREVALAGGVAFGLHLSILCAEDVPFATAAEIDSATAGTFLGRYLFDEYRGACAVWPRAAIAADARTALSGSVPALLISGFFDPVTPPEFAEGIARRLPRSHAVVMASGSHGSLGGCALPLAQTMLATGEVDDRAVRACSK